MEMIYVGEDTPVLKKGDNVLVSINSIQKEHPFVIKKAEGFPFTSINFEDYSKNFIHPSHYKPESEQKSESIYQVGDTVYYWEYGEGNIYCISHEENKWYPVFVNFGSVVLQFTIDGKINDKHKKPSLSFAPYDLTNGGFSQERPKPEPKIGDVGYFWNDENFLCAYAEIEHISRGSTFEFKPKNADYFKNFSKEPPAHIKQKSCTTNSK